MYINSCFTTGAHKDLLFRKHGDFLALNGYEFDREKPHYPSSEIWNDGNITRKVREISPARPAVNANKVVTEVSIGRCSDQPLDYSPIGRIILTFLFPWGFRIQV